MDTLNQQIYEKHRDRSLEDVQAEFQRSYQRVLRAVEEIPEEDIFTPGRGMPGWGRVPWQVTSWPIQPTTTVGQRPGSGSGGR
jgi:hypothetical protein